MKARSNRFISLELYQANELNKIIFANQEKGLPYLKEKKINQKGEIFYHNYEKKILFKELPSLDNQNYKEDKPQANKIEQNSDNKKESNSHKEVKMLKKKKKRSPSQSNNNKTNIFVIKQSSGNYPIKESSVPKVNNVKNTIKILKEKKGEEFNEICNQDMSNRSTQSSELRVNQLPNESNQDLVQSAMDTNIIILPGKAHNQLKNKNKNKKIGEKELIKALKNFLTGKKLSNILNIKIANKSQETNILSEKALLDYIDKLITKNYPLIKQGVKDTILKRLYYCIEICKKKEKKKHKVDEINDELKQPSDSEIDKQDDNDYDEKNIKKKDKKSNLVDVIIKWIETNFKEDFKEISKMELEKKEKNKSEGKLNKTKESKIAFFKTNFESFVEEHDLVQIEEAREDKKVIFDYLIKIKQEKDPVNFLKKMQKLDYLSKIKNPKLDKFLERDKIEQQFKYKNEKCRIAIYKIYKSKNLEQLLFLCGKCKFYSDKKISIKFRRPEDFEKNIRELEEYKDFKLELSQTENENIQARARKLKEIVEDPLGCLAKFGFENNKSK